MTRALALPLGLALAALACASEAPAPASPPATLALAPAPPEGPALSTRPPPAVGLSEEAKGILARRRPADENVGPCKTSADCPKTARCEQAVCVCERDYQACGGSCVPVLDRQNCGACGNACTDACLSRLGTPACGRCEAPTADCNPGSGVCTDLDDDTQNCGACGKTCGKGTACSRGACVAQRKLGAACTDNGQCTALPGSCVDGKCECTGSYSAAGGKCRSNPGF